MVVVSLCGCVRVCVCGLGWYRTVSILIYLFYYVFFLDYQLIIAAYFTFKSVTRRRRACSWLRLSVSFCLRAFSFCKNIYFEFTIIVFSVAILIVGGFPFTIQRCMYLCVLFYVREVQCDS